MRKGVTKERNKLSQFTFDRRLSKILCVFSLHDGYSGTYMLISFARLSMSSSKSASQVVVGWKSKGGEAFENELVEAISLKKLIFRGSAQIGTEDSMQYKNDLWMGKILSVHGSKGEADKNCKSITSDQSVSAEMQSTGCSKRKRRANKKLFADYDVSTTDQLEDSSAEHASAETTPQSGKHKRERRKSEKQAKKTTPAKKRKTAEEKKQELSLLCQKLNDIEESILVATPESSTERVNEEHIVDGLSESDWSDDDSLRVTSTPNQTNPLQHPHFGGKRPKTIRPPLKCVNVLCKEEKQKKDNEIIHLKEEVNQKKACVQESIPQKNFEGKRNS